MRDATRRLWLVVHAVGRLHSMVLHRRCHLVTVVALTSYWYVFLTLTGGQCRHFKYLRYMNLECVKLIELSFMTYEL